MSKPRFPNVKHLRPIYWLGGGLAFFAALSTAIAVWGDPAFLASVLSSDGVLADRTVDRVQVVRVLAALAAAAAVAVLLWLTGSRERLERALEWIRPLPRERPDRLYHALIAVVIAFFTIIHSADVLGSWRNAHGAEYLNIAESIAGGHGFSLNDSDRWFWEDFEREDTEYELDKYHLTAIEEPLYPLLLGYALYWLGEPGTAAVLLLQVLSWAATCALVYALAWRAFNRNAALLAGIAFAFWQVATYVTVDYLGPGPFGALFATATTYLAIRSAEQRSWARDALFGAHLGLSTLMLAATQVFIPVAAACTIWVRGWRERRSWIRAAAIVAIALLTISPWTVRNWQVFGELVPVRTGAGLIAHQGNPTLAASFHPSPEGCSGTIEPYWTAADAREAVLGLKGRQDKEMAIYKHSFDCIAATAPENYANFNEAQRDQLYLARARDFITSEPLLFAEMAAYKYFALLSGWGPEQALVAALAVLGGLVALRRKAGVVIVLMLAAFIGPYALGIPWGYRYRYPLEPLLLILAAHFVVRTVGVAGSVAASLRRHST